MAEKIKNINQYLSQFDAFQKNLNGESVSPINTIRKSAMEKFAELDFPTIHNEEWRYTSIKPIVQKSFVQSALNQEDIPKIGSIEKYFIPSDAQRIIFINGNYAPALSSISTISGLKILSLSDAMKSESLLVGKHLARYAGYQHEALTALNTAFIKEGAFIHIEDNNKIDLPVLILFITNSESESIVSYPRNLILVGKNSEVQIIEHYISLDSNQSFTNTVTEIVADENSHVDHLKIQDEHESTFHISTLQVHQERSSNVTSHCISLGSSITRNNINAVLNGEGCETTLNGLYVVNDHQHVDHHTLIDHAKANCSSHQLYKGILDHESRGVFNGKIIVRPDAQKTDAKQSNKNLLLSDSATIDTKPQLEIFANDVRCTHGATVGQLEDEQLFYLRARGIGVDMARRILTHAFAQDVINRLKSDSIRQYLENILTAKLEHQ